MNAPRPTTGTTHGSARLARPPRPLAGPPKRRRISRNDPPERRFPVIYPAPGGEGVPGGPGPALNFSHSVRKCSSPTIHGPLSPPDATGEQRVERRKLFSKYRTLEGLRQRRSPGLRGRHQEAPGSFGMKTKGGSRARPAGCSTSTDGKLPDTMPEMLTLPGVRARKTANVVLGNVSMASWKASRSTRMLGPARPPALASRPKRTPVQGGSVTSCGSFPATSGCRSRTCSIEQRAQGLQGPRCPRWRGVRPQRHLPVVHGV